MPHNITDVDTFTANVPTVDGSDDHQNLAGFLEQSNQALANRTHHLNQHSAKKDQANTFTQPQTVSSTLSVSGTTTLGTATISTANVTTATVTTGNITTANIGTANVSGNANVTGTVTANADFVAGGSVYATNDFECADDIRVGGDYEYKTPLPSRTKAINIFDCFSDSGTFYSGFGDYLAMNAGDSALFPVRAPHGGTLGQVRVKIENSGGTANYQMRLIRRHAINFSGAAPTVTTVDTESGSLSLGLTNNSGLSWGNLSISKDESYHIQILNEVGAPGQLRLHAIDISFVDPGPRNH